MITEDYDYDNLQFMLYNSAENLRFKVNKLTVQDKTISYKGVNLRRYIRYTLKQIQAVDAKPEDIRKYMKLSSIEFELIMYFESVKTKSGGVSKIELTTCRCDPAKANLCKISM